MKAVHFTLQEATIAKVHRAMEEGVLTCRQLVEGYIARMDAYDKKGPSLNAVIKVNPKALEIADELDEKFKRRGFIGPLHGIPVLLKDNVDTGIWRPPRVFSLRGSSLPMMPPSPGAQRRRVPSSLQGTSMSSPYGEKPLAPFWCQRQPL